MRGRSWRAHGGKARPSRGAFKPVALEIAAISIADFVPSTKELNICEFMPAASRLFGGHAVVLSRPCRASTGRSREILRALAGGDDAEAGRLRPVHHFADERRLIAVGQRVDHARLPRAIRKQRARQHVGFHRDVDDMTAGSNAASDVTDAAAGLPVISRIDVGVGLDQRHRVVGERRAAALARVVEIARPPRNRPSRCASARRGRGRSRSATPRTCSPGVVRACARNIEANLPAPMTPTRTGRPSAARALRRRARFMAALYWDDRARPSAEGPCPSW